MTKRFLSTVSVPSLAAAPVGHSGSIYFNTVDKALHVHDGLSWSPASVEYVKKLFLGVENEVLQHSGIDVSFDTATNRIVFTLEQSEFTKNPNGFENYTDSLLIWEPSFKRLRVTPRVFTEYIGIWSSTYDYSIGDVVLYGERYWKKALLSEVGNIPGVQVGTWELLSRLYVPDNFTIYVSGKRIAKKQDDIWEAPVNPGQTGKYFPGTYYIYYNQLGSLVGKTDPFNLQTECPVAVILLNEDGEAVFIADDRTNLAIEWPVKTFLRRTGGLKLQDYGFSIGDYTTTGDGSSDSHVQFSLTDGYLYNIDREYGILHSNTPTEEYEQHLRPFLKAKVYYRHQDHWDATPVQNYPIKLSTNGIPVYNSVSNSNWSDTEVPNTKYFAVWVLATNNTLSPISILNGQTFYNNLNQAKDAAMFETLDLTNSPEGLYAPLYRLLFKYDSAYTNSLKSALVDVLDLRSSSISGGALSISDHGALSGLTDDDHTQYVHISTSRIITAKHTFNPTTTDAPFTIGANAAGVLVTGLNSEKVGGKTYSEINQEALSFAQNAATDAIAASNGYTNTQFTNIDSYVAPLLTHTDHDGVAVSWNNAANKITLNVEEPTKVESNPPANPAQGDNWYDFETGVFYVYDGSFWVEVSGGNGAEAAALPSTVQYLEGTTSNIQTQLNSKAPINNPTFTGNVSLPNTTTLGGSAIAKTSDVSGLAPINNPTFTGNVSLPSNTTIGNVSSTELSYLDGVTSSIQTQLNGKISSNNPTLTGVANLPENTFIGTVTPLEIGRLSGVTGNIQTALNGKLEISNFNTAAINVQVYTNFADLPSASTNSGRIAYVNSEGSLYFAHNGAWTKMAKFSDIATGGASFSINELSDVDTATTAPQSNNVLAWNGTNWVPTNPSVASGSAPLNSPTFTGTVTLPSTTSIGNVSSTEIAHLDGVTSSIQTQINAKSNSASPTFTGTVVLPGTTSIGNVSSTEIGYLDGVTSEIQGQIDSKLSTSNFSYGSITIPTYNQFSNLPDASLNAGRLGYVSGETSLYYSNGTSWVKVARFTDIPTSFVTTINDLTDVDTITTSPTSGQVLAWNGANWVPQNQSSAAAVTYPAITKLDVTNNGSLSYQFNNQYSGNNPTIYAISGTTIAFNLSVTGHPFLIRTSALSNYNIGLIHVATDGTISTGTNAQGKTSGTLYWQIPAATTGTYKYQCSIHSGMLGDIVIKDISLI